MAYFFLILFSNCILLLANNAIPLKCINRLLVAHQNWLEDTERNSLQLVNDQDSKVGETLPVNTIHYPLLKILGKGAQGVVYLTKKNQKNISLKRFTRQTDLKNYKDELNARGKTLGLRVVKIYEMDQENQTILTQYIEGICFYEIFTKGLEYGLTPADIKYLKKIFATLKNCSAFNVVLEIKTGLIYLIDT